ncbi:hypothetical protein ACWT_0441 [Actinoplanes sp. SE50]|uniref:DUF4230 domain-containing protein n=1 Tax=unclassified Actinoplanes TaxID=2626549 RepID=UPI00023EC70B|nr:MULTISPECIES: DUF4230 domain-containing protein [unclassified Actinoplanes]AEV81453.1 hypothetical protein ACPL_556 [Actinoplanes sp. SE50/110]ATO79856.1 hypothetical protein ACWT_0441 [Actinoplanes sp. SE50]SLL97258.1 uncharacterized protein ACSP50_0456 [Actinoplanes sp. SE50/110]
MANSPDVEEPTTEYPAVPEEAEPGAPAVPQEHRPSFFARLLIFIGVVFALIVASCFGLRALHVLPSFDNPFADKTTDRSQPVLLQSMRDLHRYVAADGTFQVIVDLQQNKDNIPDFLVNRRILFVGSGTVETYVDFSALSGDALKVDNEKKTIELTLPPPQQSQAALDMQKSYVVEEDRGLLTSIGDAFHSDTDKQQRVYAAAQQKITEAAKSSGLDQRAQQNTQAMLESLFTRLGYTSVKVTFTNP